MRCWLSLGGMLVFMWGRLISSGMWFCCRLKMFMKFFGLVGVFVFLVGYV